MQCHSLHHSNSGKGQREMDINMHSLFCKKTCYITLIEPPFMIVQPRTETHKPYNHKHSISHEASIHALKSKAMYDENLISHGILTQP